MKKILSMVLSLTLISSSTMAGTEKSIGIKEAIAELNYALEVEWDQKDSAYYSKQMNLFKDRLSKLQLNGLSKDAMVKEAIAGLPASKSKNEIEQLFLNLNLDVMSDYEIQEMLIKLSKKQNSSGASWNGGIGDGISPLIVAMAMMVVLLILVATEEENDRSSGGDSDNDSDPTPSTTWKCEYRNTCTGWNYAPWLDNNGWPILNYDESAGCYQNVCGYYY